MRRYRRRILAAAAIAALAAGGCSRSTDPDGDGGRPLPPPPLQNASPRMAIVDYRPGNFNTPEWVAKFAQADLLVMEVTNFWSRPDGAELVANLRAANPDIKILAYVLGKTTWGRWGDPAQAESNPFGWAWHLATRDHWCYTTTGDTLLDWPDHIVVDILNPACRAGMVETIRRFQEESGAEIDGVFWDYFLRHLWIEARCLATLEGEPDLDHDGVGHFDDPDEQLAFQDAQVALITELRAACGEDFIQVFNGTRAAIDSSFAALGDGMFYENFPRQTFGASGQVRNALDPARFNNLFAARNWPRTRNGGPWLILSNQEPVSYYDDQGELTPLVLGDINRAVALLTDATACYHDDGQIHYGWPTVPLDLGPALGGVAREGDTFTRAFARGSITVTLTSGSYPLPFNYEIVQDGVVVQALQYPRHVP